MVGRGVVVGAVAVSLFGTLDVASAEGDVEGNESPAKEGDSSKEQTAPRIEDRANALGSAEVDRIRHLSVSALNDAAAEQFGPFDAAKQDALKQSAYFLDVDVDVFVLGVGDDAQYLAVPKGTVVLPDGSVSAPEALNPAAYGNPVFGGPWGGETINFYTATNVNNGGSECETTTAQNTLRATYRKLTDTSSSYDYYGVDIVSVAVVTGLADDCDDFIDTASIGVKSVTSGAIFASESPITGSSGSCTSKTVSVGASYSGVSASVSQTFTRCDQVGITGALQPASTWRKNIFDNNGNCHAGDQPNDGREIAHVSVIRVSQGASAGIYYSYAVNAGNADACKDDGCDGS
jgi:hypothetical protein